MRVCGVLREGRLESHRRRRQWDEGRHDQPGSQPGPRAGARRPGPGGRRKRPFAGDDRSGGSGRRSRPVPDLRRHAERAERDTRPHPRHACVRRHWAGATGARATSRRRGAQYRPAWNGGQRCDTDAGAGGAPPGRTHARSVRQPRVPAGRHVAPGLLPPAVYAHRRRRSQRSLHGRRALRRRARAPPNSGHGRGRDGEVRLQRLSWAEGYVRERDRQRLPSPRYRRRRCDAHLL